MMEEEIERTREEIHGIEEACEKVERMLENVIQGGASSVKYHENQPLKPENDRKMEDIIVQETVTEGLEQATNETKEQKWFEDEWLLGLWNGV